MRRNAEGRVVLTLDENFYYGSEGEDWESVQTARTTIVLAETLGRDIWASVHKQRGNAIELALKDGARVTSVEVPPPSEEPRSKSWRVRGAELALRAVHHLVDEVRRRERGGA
ncbi:hypothetical protein [Myxococcus xanthus]|uniref:hypothetical protein n=1 Tax=Myxococcus xanthus TaxID=34 RepID=UPI0011286B86|nr:hypothetical protein [Myxococcus xanthus]QDE83300.1 hypothetical protein BHS07_18020 [Myxococcus xanthus]